MQDLRERLNQSPLLHISNGSKELFHSNFLYWISSVNDFGDGYSGREAFADLINFISQKTILDNSTDWKVFREKEKFDLSVAQKTSKGKKYNDYILIIENKMKSIPSLSQLNEYDEKLQKSNPFKILLTLITNFIGNKEIEEKGWKIISYEDLVNAIKKVLLPKLKNCYYWNLLVDYCDFMDNLMEYCKKFNISETSLYKIEEKEAEENNRLRISDLIRKLRTSLFAMMMQKRIKDSGLDNYFHVTTGYTRTDAFLEIWYPASKENVENILNGGQLTAEQKEIKRKYKKFFVIEIQGDTYEHCIIPCSQEEEKDLSENYSSFFANSIREFQSQRKDFFDGTKSKRNFLVFGNNNVNQRMAHQYAKIKDTTTIQQLIEYVIHDLENILNLTKNIEITEKSKTDKI